jgi:hypothetical protein
MSKMFSALDADLRAFIARQRIFFVSSAAAQTRVNVSPRGARYFRILTDDSVCWLDRTGSSNETAAHIRAGGRVTVMFCAFDGAPGILRLYGRGEVLHRNGRAFSELAATQFDDNPPPGTRQIVRLTMDSVQMSCGYGVPEFDFRCERTTLDDMTVKAGPDGISAFWGERNRFSIDGLPTGLLDPYDE